MLATAADDALDLSRVREAVSAGRVREIRRRHHLTQADVGRAVGVSREAVSAWEAGRRVPQSAELALRYLGLLDALERQHPEQR